MSDVDRRRMTLAAVSILAGLAVMAASIFAAVVSVQAHDAACTVKTSLVKALNADAAAKQHTGAVDGQFAAEESLYARKVQDPAARRLLFDDAAAGQKNSTTTLETALTLRRVSQGVNC